MTDLLPVMPATNPGQVSLIAGPCSAESESQLLELAPLLSACGVGVLRAGVWKPRTKPGGFEGLGAVALPWLVKAARSSGMLSATEVGSSSHVRRALDAGVDILWVGARTAANPFAVQEIADALQENASQVSVLVKNPVNPDLELWIGALERIYGAGVRRLGAVHRGFSCYRPDIYRNPPHWSIPIELHRRLPQLPLICDPSHIGGRSELIAPLSQQALDIGFESLMIEVHECPDKALSDSRQQLTPSRLATLVRSLKVRRRAEDRRELDALREKIDECDRMLIDALALRMEVSRSIGEYKREHNMPVLQIGRHDFVMRSRVDAGREAGLSPEFMRRLMSAVHEESVRAQTELFRTCSDSDRHDR